MYARGILFGKMKYELGDHSYVRCPETGLIADVEFKTKGYFSGTYNAIGGFIRNEKTGETLYELSGMWSGEMVAKNVTVGTFAENDRPAEYSPKHRLARRKFYLTPRMLSTHPPKFAHCRNRMNASLRNYGTLPF